MNGQTLGGARVPLPGGAVARYTSGPTLSAYWHPDWQGSVRFASTVTSPTGEFYDSGIAPYGESYDSSAPLGTVGVFAGTIQDTIAGMFDTPGREYDPPSGRWLSPDPAGLAAVDLTNPQSLNRYAYVGNNPTTLIDPSGLGPQGQSTQTCGHGFVVPQGQNPAVWCYNHMGIGAGSGPGAFFTNTADEFDLIGLVLAAGNQGSYYWPCPNGDCGYKTQAIFTPTYSPADLADLLNALLVLAGLTYQPGRGLNSAPPKDSPGPVPDWGSLGEDPQTCHSNMLSASFGSPAPSFVARFSAYSYLPDSENFDQAWSTTAESLALKGGALGIGYLMGGAVRTGAVFLAEEAVPLAATGLTATATVMDLRARIACGQGF